MNMVPPNLQTYIEVRFHGIIFHLGSLVRAQMDTKLYIIKSNLTIHKRDQAANSQNTLDSPSEFLVNWNMLKQQLLKALFFKLASVLKFGFKNRQGPIRLDT